MAKSAAVPRFLLPQLTWKPLFPQTFGFTPRINTSLSKRKALTNPPHRTLTSIAQPWHEHGRKSRPTSCRSNIHKSQPRPSSAAGRETSNSLRAAFRILSQKPFSTTSYLFRDHHFDTLKLVQRLKDEGFSEEQSKAMMLVLSDVIEESIQNLTRTMVLREGRLPFPVPIGQAYRPKTIYDADCHPSSQTLTAVPTRKRSTSPNSAPNSLPSTPATPPSPLPPTNAFPMILPN